MSPEVRRRRLAAELRRLRAESGLKTTEVARQLGWSPSKVSRYELARTGLKPTDVRRMLAFYGVEARRQDDLLALAVDAAKRAWWEEYSDVLSDDHIALVGLEDEATAESAWHLEVIPGLLQTEGYARRLISRGYSLSPVPPRQIDRIIRLRMRRQEVLIRRPPLQLSAVVDEAVLHRRVGGPEVMREQLRHLIEVAQLPNVSLRVLRLDEESPAMINSFDVLRFGDQGVGMPDVVYTEHFRGTLNFEDEADTHQYFILFRMLQEAALSESRSIRFIEQIIGEVWSVQADSLGAMARRAGAVRAPWHRRTAPAAWNLGRNRTIASSGSVTLVNVTAECSSSHYA
jgi:transcriptional regulator with XRE-family HTH domain